MSDNYALGSELTKVQPGGPGPARPQWRPAEAAAQRTEGCHARWGGGDAKTEATGKPRARPTEAPGVRRGRCRWASNSVGRLQNKTDPTLKTDTSSDLNLMRHFPPPTPSSRGPPFEAFAAASSGCQRGHRALTRSVCGPHLPLAPQGPTPGAAEAAKEINTGSDCASAPRPS